MTYGQDMLDDEQLESGKFDYLAADAAIAEVLGWRADIEELKRKIEERINDIPEDRRYEADAKHQST